MKNLLTITAVLEGMTGLVFLLLPEIPVSILIGTQLDTQAGLVVGRLSGAALLALSFACWIARNDINSRAAFGIVLSMLIYNVVAVALLIYVYIGLELCGIGLWPVIFLHLAMGAWCVVCLRRTKNVSGNEGTLS